MSRARQEKIFENVPGHTRVKKVNCQLAHLFGFEPELKHAKTVIEFLCGINDLAGYGKTSTAPRSTNFVFNSLTSNIDQEHLLAL